MCVPGAELRLFGAQGIKLTQALSHVRPPYCLLTVSSLDRTARRHRHAIASERAPARCGWSPSWFFQLVIGPEPHASAQLRLRDDHCWSTRKAPVKACYVSTALVARAVYSLPSSPKNTASCWLRSPQHAGGTNPSGACGLRRGERADHVLGFRGGPHASLQRPQAQTASLQFVGGVGATDCRPGLRSPKMRLR
jgi:hypothetical protein